MFFILLCAYIGLIFLKTVSATRHALANNLEDYLMLSLYYLKNNDAFFDAIKEFGNTVFPYIIVVDGYPRYVDFSWGKSLFYVWILVIPGMGKLLPSLRHDVSITSQISPYYKYWYGGAFGQELYGNFSILAVIFSVFAGRLMRKMLGMYDKSSSIVTARYFSMYYALLNLVRSDLNEFCRLILWAFFIPIIIQWIFFKEKND
jgi:hypothetical protein